MSKQYLFSSQMYHHICEMFDHYCEKCTGNFVRNTSVMHFSCICSSSLRVLTGLNLPAQPIVTYILAKRLSHHWCWILCCI